jgi:hypothetical protein
VRDSIEQIFRPRLAEFRESREHDPPRPGEWEWFGVPSGVLVQVSDCDHFEAMIAEFAAGLERRGIEAPLELHEYPPPPEARPLAAIGSCHLRVRGSRERFDYPDGPVFRWRPDASAYAAVITAVVAWCGQLGEGATYEVSKGTIGPVAFGFHDDLVGALNEAIADGDNGTLRGSTCGAWREVRIASRVGSVALAIGGAAIDAGNWDPALEELTNLLRASANLLGYAHVRRRSQPGFRDPLDRDWPQRPNHEPRGGGSTNEAFEDVFAPDALAVQFLGAGYADRVPDSPSYRQTRVGEGGTLLEHVDLPAWFDAPFVPHGQRPDPDEPPPPVLAEARRQLAPILYTPGALHRAGYVDVPDL